MFTKLSVVASVDNGHRLEITGGIVGLVSSPTLVVPLQCTIMVQERFTAYFLICGGISLKDEQSCVTAVWLWRYGNLGACGKLCGVVGAPRGTCGRLISRREI